MITSKRARILAGFVCGMAIAGGAAVGQVAGDEPPRLTEDVSEDEVRPPNSSDEGSGFSDTSDRSSDGPAAQAEPQAPVAKPSSSSAASDKAAREAAKRSLLSEPAKDPQKPNPLLDERGPDYYDRRAKDLLNDERGVVELHPLMQAHPDSYVVVCVAGCSHGKSAEVVSILPRQQPAFDPGQPPDSAGVPLSSCVGGCGPNGSNALAAAPQPAAQTPVTAIVSEWTTTVAQIPAGAPDPTPKPSGESGVWMEKIQQDRAAAQANAPAATAPQATKSDTDSGATAAPGTSIRREPLSSAEPETKEIAASTAMPAVEATVGAPPAIKPRNPPPDVIATTAEAVVTKPAAETTAGAAQSVVASEPAEQQPIPAKAPSGQQQIADLRSRDKTAEAAADPSPANPAAPPATASKAAEPQKIDEIAAAASQKTAPADSTAPAATAARTSSSEAVVAKVTPPSSAKHASPLPPSAPKDGVISVLSEDKEMNAAIQRAQRTIDTFWKSYEGLAANETDHALKVAIPGDGTTEHFWLTRIRRDGGKLSGVISNRPQNVTTVKLGQRYEFTPETISDWTFKRNGKLVGNETMRVLLPRMPEEQAAVYRQMYETP
jgi:uncharacterized protein YegJ (DUF2314 family)